MNPSSTISPSAATNPSVISARWTKPSERSACSPAQFRDAALMYWMFAALDWMIFFIGRLIMSAIKYRPRRRLKKTALLPAPTP